MQTWKSILMTLLMMAVLGSVIAPLALGASIVGSKHDFANNTGFTTDGEMTNFAGFWTAPGAAPAPPLDQPCVFCHTPHGANASAPAPLWNRTNPVTTTFTVYQSPTFTLNNSTVGGLTLICMSCHDGISSVAVNSLLNPQGNAAPNEVSANGNSDQIRQVYNTNYLGMGITKWGPNIGNIDNTAPAGTAADLSNDHPVSFTWVEGLPGIKAAIPWGNDKVKLFNNRMECSTCHKVHDPAIKPFLRMTNSGSDMCLTCHDK